MKCNIKNLSEIVGLKVKKLLMPNKQMEKEKHNEVKSKL